MSRIKELFAPKDLTEGPPWKRIIEFSIPLLIGNVAQQLYNTADSIIVGRYLGEGIPYQLLYSCLYLLP